MVEEQKQSGKTVKGFCGEQGLQQWQFFSWKKRLKEAGAERFLEVKVKTSEASRYSAEE